MQRFELTIPPNTSERSPATAVYQFIGSGRSSIEHWIVRIPKGHAYLAYFQMRAGRQSIVIPDANSGASWLRGDGEVIEGRGHIQLDPPQYAVEMRGYNLDDTYPHTFFVDLE